MTPRKPDHDTHRELLREMVILPASLECSFRHNLSATYSRTPIHISVNSHLSHSNIMAISNSNGKATSPSKTSRGGFISARQPMNDQGGKPTDYDWQDYPHYQSGMDDAAHQVLGPKGDHDSLPVVTSHPTPHGMVVS
jgi:hypothetical protein